MLALLLGLLRHAPAGSVLAFLLRIVANTAVWLLLQSLLLSRRIPIRRLLPGAIVIAVGSAILSLYSALWLIVVGLRLVAAAVISAEIGGAPKVQHRPVIPDSHSGPPPQEGAIRSGTSLGGGGDIRCAQTLARSRRRWKRTRLARRCLGGLLAGRPLFHGFGDQPADRPRR